jgi:type IV secretory pathway VirJ component
MSLNSVWLQGRGSAGAARVPRRIPARVLCWISLSTACLSSCSAWHAAGPAQTVAHGGFATVRIYRPAEPPRQLALLISGDGGWSEGMDSIAHGLTAIGTLVAGIDGKAFLDRLRHDPAACVSPGDELADLAGYLQQHYQLPRTPPLLIGHSAGATLAFIALQQEHDGTFAGALTLSFCVDFDVVKPLCPAPGIRSLPRSDGVRLVPAASPRAPWVALHGLADTVCPVREARVFNAELGNSQFLGIRDITHSWHHSERWWPQFVSAYEHLVAAPGAEP